MMITWKVLHTVMTIDLEDKLNELATQDYDIYRLEFIESGFSESGTLPLPPPPTQPINLHVNTLPSSGIVATSPTTFQNSGQGYVTSGSMSKNRTRLGYWIIVACRVET